MSFVLHSNLQPVYVNVYDLSPINDYMFPFGLGAYHSGIQVHGKEYTFGSGAGKWRNSLSGWFAEMAKWSMEIRLAQPRTINLA